MATPPVAKKPAAKPAAKPAISSSDRATNIKRDIAVAVIAQCTEQQLLTAPGKVIAVIRKITDEVLA